MASKGSSYANEDRRFSGATVDIPFLVLVLTLLAVGLKGGPLWQTVYAVPPYK